MNKNKWLDWAVELQSLAQAGLKYTNDVFDRERFERIREISAEIVAHQSEIPIEKVRDIFCCEQGYQTPKLDSRASIIKDNKILLVHEKNGTWSLPGGWVDVDISVGENVVKEVREEAGLIAVPEKVVAVQDREKHNRPVYANKICKVFVQCRVIGGEFKENPETTGFDYFGIDELPQLATEKINKEQIQMCFDAYNDDNWKTLLD